MKSSAKMPRGAHQIVQGRADYPELQELIRRCRELVNIRILRLPQVKAKTGLAYSTIWKASSDGTLPPPFSIGTKSVGWLEHELDAVIAARLFASRSGQPVDFQAFVALLIASNDSVRTVYPTLPSGTTKGN